VQTFGDGQDALNAYDQHGADLLLVNHGMPHLDGPALIRTLRARGDTVPIIGMSGNPYYCADYMDVGATAFLTGPELLGELARLLRRFLSPEERAYEVGGA
jgi:two-component system response regulator QseB